VLRCASLFVSRYYIRCKDIHSLYTTTCNQHRQAPNIYENSLAGLAKIENRRIRFRFLTLLSITMTAHIGGLSTAVIAVIAVGGVAVLLAAITISAWCCDLPAKRRRRKAIKNGGKISPDMDEVDVEKNEPAVSVTAVDSQVNRNSKSGQDTRAPSPVCRCEHPSLPPSPQITIQPPRIGS